MDDKGIGVKKSLDSDKIDVTNTGSDPSAFSAKGHFYQINDMVNAIIEDRDPYITGRMARYAVHIILAIYESSKTNKEVFIEVEYK